MSPQTHLSDSAVRKLAGPKRYERAMLALSAGKVIERTAFANNVFTGRWDEQAEAPLSAMSVSDGQVLLDCVCDDFDIDTACEHAIALALAWARAPHTFALIQHEADFDTLLDEFLEITELGVELDDDGFEDDEPATVPAALGPANSTSAAAPTAEHATLTLSWRRAALTEAFRALLEYLTVDELRQLAQRRGIKLRGTKREPIVAALAEALGQPAAVLAALSRLSAPAQLMLGLVPFIPTATGFNVSRLRQILPTINAPAAAAFQPALEELQQAGLVVERNGYWMTVAGLHYWLPPDANLAPVLAKSGDLRLVRAPNPLQFAAFALQLLLTVKGQPAQVRLSERTPLAMTGPARELADWPFDRAEVEALAREKNFSNAFYGRALSLAPAEPLLIEASSQALQHTLAAPARQIELGLRLLGKLGLLILVPGQSPAVLDNGFAQYVSHPPIEHVSHLYDAWLNLREWSEVDWVTAAPDKLRLRRQGYLNSTYAQMVSSLSLARVSLTHLLRRAPVGEWLDVAGLVARAGALNLDGAMWPLPPGMTLALSGHGLNLAKAEDWQRGYGPFLESILTGPLHWLGLVDLGYRQAQLAAFRLTDLGAFLLFQRDTYTAPPLAQTGAALIFAPDGSLLLQPAAADAQLLGLLSLLGEARAGPLGALSYHLSAAGAVRAFEAGHDPDQILARLAKSAGAPPPLALAQRLRDWWEHFGDAHIYQDLALMELADDYALNELLAATSLSEYLLYRFSPRLIALRPEGVAPLQEQMAAKGYTPKWVTN